MSPGRRATTLRSAQKKKGGVSRIITHNNGALTYFDASGLPAALEKYANSCLTLTPLPVPKL